MRAAPANRRAEVKIIFGAATEDDAAAAYKGDGNVPGAIVAEVFGHR